MKQLDYFVTAFLAMTEGVHLCEYSLPFSARAASLRAQRSNPIGVEGLPILKPPYSTITAFDMNSGEILWRVPNGAGSAQVENSPALEGIDLPPLGGGGRHAVLVTSSLLIHGQNAGYGPLLVARNKETGEEMATIEIPANPSGAPMSYSVDGQQYIAISIGSTQVPELVVYALP